jgi:hypothetical protein
MIAHVAQTGEDRGRVVLELRSGRPNAIALEAAVRIARAFESEIDGIFIEDAQLIDCAAYAFAREISLSGRERRRVSTRGIERDLRLAGQLALRQIAALARQENVPLRTRVVRDEPLRALSIACAERGPWNVVVLAEPFGAAHAGHLKQLLVEIADTTGLVLVGPKARRLSGPIVAALEDTERLGDLLRVAERLAALDGTEILLLVVAPDEEQAQNMEGAARLALEAREGVRIATAELTRGAAAVVAETLRRLNAGFVVCRFGGVVVPEEGDLRPLMTALESPLLLVR